MEKETFFLIMILVRQTDDVLTVTVEQILTDYNDEHWI